MSRRPDRRAIMQDTINKQEDDAKMEHGGGGEYINCFKFPEDVKVEWLSLKPDEPYEMDVIPFEVTSKNHPGFSKLQVYEGNYREDYAMTYFAHKKIGPGGKATVPCPEMNWGKPCPICEERKRLLDEKIHEWDDDELAPYKWKSRTALTLRDVNDGTKKLFDYPTAWFLKNLLNKSKRVRGAESQVCMSDLSKDGYSISFYAEEGQYKTKKGDPTPGEVKDIEFIKRKEDLDESLIDEAYKVDKYMNVFSYEELEAIMHGEYEGSEDDSTDDEKEVKNETPKEEKEDKLSEREKRLAEREAKKKKEDSGNASPINCPHGMRFGEDNLAKDCCNEDDCSCYDACEKEFDRLNS